MFDSLIRFFSLNLNQYENIGIDFPIGIFLSLLCLAFCISLFFIYHRKRVSTEVLTALIRHEAYDEKNAKTLKSLHIDGFFVRYEIQKSKSLSSIISIVGREKLSYEEYLKLDKQKQRDFDKIDFENALFYIKEEENEKALLLAEGKGVSILSPIILSALSIVILFLLARFLPDLLRLIK